MSELSGFLYVRLGDYGSRSEGPEYFVQHSKDAAEDVPVKKHAELWLDDTKLKRYLATKVTLTGESSPGGFIYTKIGPLLTTSATTPVVENGGGWEAWVDLMPKSEHALHVKGGVIFRNLGVTATLARVGPDPHDPATLVLQVLIVPLTPERPAKSRKAIGAKVALSYSEINARQFARVRVECPKGSGFPIQLDVGKVL
jgi:hypothetical protein